MTEQENEIERLRVALEQIADPSTVSGMHDQDRDRKLQRIAKLALHPEPRS